MTNFYGKNIETLKLFGQKRWGECSPGRVNGRQIFHGAGVLVDTYSKPNHIYAADTGNNRILGFRSYDSAKANIVFGQPDEFSGAPNGDCNTGMFGEARRDTLCLIGVPGNPNLGEQFMRLNLDVDTEGNLYVPDFYNNRVLMYRTPFSADKTDGKGDNLPDLVLGQADFSSNAANRGGGPTAQSLYISVGGNHVSARGVSVDLHGNVWVADTFNHRVLRFPKGSTTANIVIGQPNFTSNESETSRDPKLASANRLFTPTLARINPYTGELFVIDEYPDFLARILLFRPPFKNGMAATRVIFPLQKETGDYAAGYQLSHATGLVFHPLHKEVPTDNDPRAHQFWLHDSGPHGEGKRTLLMDDQGKILQAIAAPDLTTFGGKYGELGIDAEEPFNVSWAGGMIGLDSEDNIYLADDFWHRVARYALPYRVGHTPPPNSKPILPSTNGGLFASPLTTKIGPFPNNMGPGHFSGPGVGAITFQGQLIVRDTRRYMVWNDYLTSQDGAPANVFVGQPTGSDVTQNNFISGLGNHTIDHLNRLWTNNPFGELMVYQLPLISGALPLADRILLYWADELPGPASRIPANCLRPLAFDPRTRKFWIYDAAFHRLLRVSNVDRLDYLKVDAVIGQPNKTEKRINHGNARPDANSLGDVNNIRFDHLGNLFVVDNNYELHDNGRIIAFLAGDLQAIDQMFPPILAKLVYVAGGFDEPVGQRHFPPGEHPKSPVCLAFNSRNEMVVGNDGYDHFSDYDPRTHHFNQLYLYRNPLTKVTPDAVIELPLGAPGEICFDEQDNLIVQDHIWNKVWVINYDRDPEWLRPLQQTGPARP